MRNKDELKGKGKRIKGKIKAKAGEILGDRNLEAEGEAERIVGIAQEGYGRARRKADELVKKVRRSRMKE
jgi:uncharacterized protein YjbJ (UPF0337 family)